MKLLVCGGRDYSDRKAVFNTLYDFCDKHGLWTEPTPDGNKLPNNIHIINGKAPGADALSTDWAIVNWVPFTEYRADWEKHGRAAGPIRNQQMIDEGKPDKVLAFPGGRGTADIVARARTAGIEVIEVTGK